MAARVFLVVTLVGAGVLAYPSLTDFYSNGQQRRLADEFGSDEIKTRFAKGDLRQGQVMSRIEIDSIRVRALVVEGTGPKVLRAGAGHYSSTPMPCEEGNVAIAGHRTTFGKPFRRLNELKVGQTIRLTTPQRKCTYRVIARESEPNGPRPGRRFAAWVTTPDDTSVLLPLPGSMLTLTTCHPKGSAKQRLILRAKLIS